MKNTYYYGRTITLSKEDINNPLHPFLWEEICEDLEFDPKETETLDLKVFGGVSNNES
tara:strand:+ start:473 stop:646 length:174 start_codon:yes stop_codon:yes gene_type:complete